jgi:4-amino-4-deoxy-L-arabinose transferase-like glycosyltransferase
MRNCTLLVVPCYAVVCFFLLYCGKFTLQQTHNFDRDEAAHAVWALELTQSFAELNLERLWHAVVDQAFYPPLYSLSVAPFYLVLGPSQFSSRLPSYCIYCLTLLILALILHREAKKLELHPQLVQIAPLLGVTAGALSPLTVVNSSLAMLEPLATLWFVLLLLLFSNLSENIVRVRCGILFGTLLVAAALTKYTLPILFGPAWLVTLLLFTRATRDPRKTAISIVIPALIVAGVIGAVWCCITDFNQIWFYLFEYPKRGVLNTWSAFLFYPRQLFEVYTLHRVQGVLLLIGAVIAIRFIFNSSAVRFAAFSLGFSYLLFSLQSEKGARHFLPVLPALWFLGSLGICVFLQKIRNSAGPAILLSCLIGLVGITMIGTYQALPHIRELALRKFESAPEFTRLTAAVLPRLNIDRPILLLGEQDTFSKGWLQWSIAKDRDVSFRSVAIEAPRGLARVRNRNAKSAMRAEFTRRVRALTTSGSYGTIILFTPTELRDTYQEIFPQDLFSGAVETDTFRNERAELKIVSK